MTTFIGIASDPRYKDKLVEMTSSADIPMRWRGTPIEHFIQAQNFGYPLHPQVQPQVLIVSCMEFRYSLPVPANYAYVIRTPGGRLIGSELAVGYALHRGVKNILLIAHDDCGMTHLVELGADIIKALIDQGWGVAPLFPKRMPVIPLRSRVLPTRRRGQQKSRGTLNRFIRQRRQCNRAEIISHFGCEMLCRQAIVLHKSNQSLCPGRIDTH